MTNSNNTTTYRGIGFFGLLGIVFIVLKLTGVIAWSWLWVLAPLWMPAAFWLVVVLVLLVIRWVVDKL